MQLPVPTFNETWLPPVPGSESVGLPPAVPLAPAWPADGLLQALPPIALQPFGLAVDTVAYDASCSDPVQVSTLPTACST